MIRPGPSDLITDVPGFHVSNAHDVSAITEVTIVLLEDRVVGAVDVRGGGPGTRETDVLSPGCLAERIDAVVLSDGSAFGLAAADAAMLWLAACGRGYPAGTRWCRSFRVP